MQAGTLTNDGGIAIFGWTGSQKGDVSINYGMYDMWLVKLNSDGDIEWDKSFGTDDFDWGIDIIHTNDNGFLVGGSSTIGSGGNLTCDPYNYNAECILLKLDSIGNVEWQNCYGGSMNDGINALLELEDGYLISAYGESEDGDLLGSGWHGGADIWVIKIDLFGNIIWQKCYGGSYYESALNLFSTDDNGFVLVGATESHNGDITNNHSISEYDNDIWFLKIDSVGQIITQKCFGGIGNEFIYGGVLQKSDNNYIIAAYTDYGPSHNVACTPFGGNGVDKDWWVFEISLDDTTALHESLPGSGNLDVYPNPAKDYIIFEMPAKAVAIVTPINIFDIYGRKVASLQMVSGKAVLDVRSFNSGIYFYQLSHEGRHQAGKFVVR